MIEICPKNQCTGCGACTGVCPKNCIFMDSDKLGHIYPVIDHSKCIDCKKCERTCPNNSKPKFSYPFGAYAAWSVDPNDRISSTSGGVASVLSGMIIKWGGVVYGASVVGVGLVEHQRAETFEDIVKFKLSKYVQSVVRPEIIHQLKEDVKKGRDVLFIGTPCQTAGIRSSVGTCTNLYCVDLICHGIPSQQIFQDHLKKVTGKDYSDITFFSTRDKDGYYLSVYKSDKILYRKGFPSDEYLNGFQYSLFSRPSCFVCQYARPERQSDLTIGDFWGLKAESYPHQKVSVVLTNTPNGKLLIDRCGSALFLDPRPVEEAVSGNAQLRFPAKPHEFYNLFRLLYPKYGYTIAINLSLFKFRIKNKLFVVLLKIPGFKKYYNNRLKC